MKLCPTRIRALFMRIKKSVLLSIVTTTMLLFTSCMSLSSYPQGKITCEVSVEESRLFKDKEAIEFSAKYFLNNKFVEFFQVYNNTNERIYIEWENARCNHGKVIFSDDRRITMNNAKQDEAVSPNSYSLLRDITSATYVGNDYLIPLFNKKDLIAGDVGKVFLLIPIRFSDGSVTEYHLTLSYKWTASDN